MPTELLVTVKKGPPQLLSGGRISSAWPSTGSSSVTSTDDPLPASGSFGGSSGAAGAAAVSSSVAMALVPLPASPDETPAGGAARSRSRLQAPQQASSAANEVQSAE